MTLALFNLPSTNTARAGSGSARGRALHNLLEKQSVSRSLSAEIMMLYSLCSIQLIHSWSPFWASHCLVFPCSTRADCPCNCSRWPT